MDRQRFTFQQALKQLQITYDDVDSGSEAEVTSNSECESTPDTDELPLEEEICDIDVFMEESEMKRLVVIWNKKLMVVF